MWSDRVTALRKCGFLAMLAVAAMGNLRKPAPADPAGPAQKPKAEDVAIITETLPDAVAGEPYRTRLQATGGREPYGWSLKVPWLPQGLALSASGEISGKPAFPDMQNFTVLVADSNSPPKTATRILHLLVVYRLVMLTRFLPDAQVGAPYRVQLHATGGTTPMQWDVSGGVLPPGLVLNELTGVLEGTPAADGDFRFTVRVRDAGSPRQAQTRTFQTRFTRPLSVAWVRPPRVDSGGIHGSVRVWNGYHTYLDVTVIVVAVIEYGKAFTLGYEKLVLGRERFSPEIVFGTPLPRGNYMVHVDAVGEFPPRSIFRDRQQQGPFRVE